MNLQKIHDGLIFRYCPFFEKEAFLPQLVILLVGLHHVHHLCDLINSFSMPPPLYLSIYLFECQSINHLPTYLSIYISLYLLIYK